MGQVALMSLVIVQILGLLLLALIIMRGRPLPDWNRD